MRSDGKIQQVHPMLALAAALAMAGGTVVALPRNGARDPQRHLGPELRIGEGTARSYVTVDEGGNPTAVGIALTEGALRGLDGGHGHHENVLTLPIVRGIVFQHITFDWNPAGHEPPGVYDTPHFDAHFYTISDAVRRTIDPSIEGFAEKAARLPAADRIPAGYMADPNGAVPMMGVHWVDPTSPEFTPAGFSRTLIVGSWDGEVTFIEPMLTRAWILSKPDFRAPLPQPETVPVTGYWPTEWSVRFDQATHEYRIELGGLVRREAAPSR